MSSISYTWPSQKMRAREELAKVVIDQEWQELCTKVNEVYVDWVTHREVNTYILPVTSKKVISDIAQGLKRYEVRIFGPTCKQFCIRDNLHLLDETIRQGVECQITSLDVYYSFEEMLRAKGVFNLLPEVYEEAGRLKAPGHDLLKEAAMLYANMCEFKEVFLYGVVVIGLRFLRCIKV